MVTARPFQIEGRCQPSTKQPAGGRPAERTRLIFRHTLSEGAGVGASARTSAECRCACILQEGRAVQLQPQTGRKLTLKCQLTNRSHRQNNPLQDGQPDLSTHTGSSPVSGPFPCMQCHAAATKVVMP